MRIGFIQNIIDIIKGKKLFNIHKILKQLRNYKLQGYDTLYIPVGGIGDGIIFTPVAKAIYNRDKKKLLVSHKNNELFKNNPYIETIDGLYDTVINKKIEKKIKNIGFDIVYPTYWNFPKKDGKYHLAYPKQHIIAETASKAGYTGMIELKPEIYLTDKEKKFGRFCNDKKQIVIMSTAIDKHKQWDKWQELVDSLKDKYYFIQLGAPNDLKLEGIDDRRGKYTLRECSSILYNSDLFVGQIGGLMHMARAVDCPAVIAYSGAEPDYFDSYICNENVKPKDNCNICTDNNTSAYSEHCKNDYCCVKSIYVQDMSDAIEKILNKKIGALEFVTNNIVNSMNIHLESYYKRYSKDLLFIRK